MIFPESREAFFELINGQEHEGRTVSAYYVLPRDWSEGFPAAEIHVQRGAVHGVDRTEIVVINLYADAGEALPILHSIGRVLCDSPHSVEGVGLIDVVKYEETPRDIPYYSMDVMQAQAAFRTVSRPVRSNG